MYPRIRVQSDRHPEDESQAAQSEREEALWCQVILFGERIKRLEEQLQLAHELIALQREKLKVPDLPVKGVKLKRIITEDGQRLRYPVTPEKRAEIKTKQEERWKQVSKTGKCLDCGKGISPTSQRCLRCACVERHRVRLSVVQRTPGTPEGFTQTGGNHGEQGRGGA